MKNKRSLLVILICSFILLLITFSNFLHYYILIALYTALGLIIYIYGSHKKDNKYSFIIFILYFFLLIYILFLSKGLHRNRIIPEINLIPFKSIDLFIKNFNSVSNINVIANLLGNFILFMPVVLFLKYFGKCKSLVIILITFLLCAGTEVTQYYIGVGSLDIDDFILNFSGAFILLMLLNINKINLFFEDLILYKDNYSKKTMNKIIIFIITFIFIILGFLILYRKHLYNKQMEELIKTRNPNITFNYEKSCSPNNLFYEDEVFKYMLDCYDADKFYFIFNNKDKMKIKDVFKDKKYEYDIDRANSILAINKIKVNKERKHNYFELKNPSSDCSYAGIINRNYFKLVTSIDPDKEDTIEYNIIPKMPGQSIVKIKFETKDNVINRYVEINIDKNLKSTYKIIN